MIEQPEKLWNHGLDSLNADRPNEEHDYCERQRCKILRPNRNNVVSDDEWGKISRK